MFETDAEAFTDSKSQKKIKRGSIDFDFPETKMMLDENG